MATRSGNTLSLWMNGEHVGWWRNADGDRQELVYSEQWRASPRARPISLSLPFTPANQHRGPRVRAYFENLLPDSKPILERLASRFRLGSTQAFELLREIGRDCVGALQLLPEGEAPQDVHRIEGEPLTEAQIENILQGVVRPSIFTAGLDDEFRISIAGAQEKTALLHRAGQWMRPLGATPTTHIFKLPLGRIGNLGLDLSGSVENEWLCAQLLDAFGIPVAACRIGEFGTQKALIVERFDRRSSSDASWLVRIPQEDFCQVFGLPPWQKYESDGGPGVASIMGVLAGSLAREKDRITFLRAQVLFWMLAAIDGHGKNFSLSIEAGGAYRMTPLYDVISAWPMCGDGVGKLPYRKLKLAMAVRSKNAHYHLHTIQRRHWIETARRHGLGPDAESILDELASRTPAAIETVERRLPPHFPPQIAEAVFAGLRKSAERLGADH